MGLDASTGVDQIRHDRLVLPLERGGHPTSASGKKELAPVGQ
jgi:hypothetical protein